MKNTRKVKTVFAVPALSLTLLGASHAATVNSQINDTNGARTATLSSTVNDVYWTTISIPSGFEYTLNSITVDNSNSIFQNGSLALFNALGVPIVPETTLAATSGNSTVSGGGATLSAGETYYVAYFANSGGISGVSASNIALSDTNAANDVYDGVSTDLVLSTNHAFTTGAASIPAPSEFTNPGGFDMILDVTQVVVPEPSSVLLLGLSGLTLLGRRRRTA